MIQVKEFIDDAGELGLQMNRWLKNYGSRVHIVNIAYSTTGTPGDITSSALIIYETHSGEDE